MAGKKGSEGLQRPQNARWCSLFAHDRKVPGRLYPSILYLDGTAQCRKEPGTYNTCKGSRARAALLLAKPKKQPSCWQRQSLLCISASQDIKSHFVVLCTILALPTRGPLPPLAPSNPMYNTCKGSRALGIDASLPHEFQIMQANHFQSQISDSPNSKVWHLRLGGGGGGRFQISKF